MSKSIELKVNGLYFEPTLEQIYDAIYWSKPWRVLGATRFEKTIYDLLTSGI